MYVNCKQHLFSTNELFNLPPPAARRCCTTKLMIVLLMAPSAAVLCNHLVTPPLNSNLSLNFLGFVASRMLLNWKYGVYVK